MPLKEAAMPVAGSHGPSVLDAAGTASALEIGSLKALYEDLWKFTIFGPAAARERLGEAARRLLGIENTLRPAGAGQSPGRVSGMGRGDGHGDPAGPVSHAPGSGGV
jgi:hypothetical protein